MAKQIFLERGYMAGRWYVGFAVTMVVVSMGVSVYVIVVASSRALSPLEGALFQVVALGTGLLGSFLFGRMAVEKAELDRIRPYVRSAFRRAYSLSESLQWLGDRTQEMYDDDPDPRLELILALVEEQYVTVGDSLEDLRDIAPEDIDEIERRYAEDDDDSD